MAVGNVQVCGSEVALTLVSEHWGWWTVSCRSKCVMCVRETEKSMLGFVVLLCSAMLAVDFWLTN